MADVDSACNCVEASAASWVSAMAPRAVLVSPRICVVVPVYNHGLTVQSVVRGAKAKLPVIVINDTKGNDLYKQNVAKYKKG